MAGCRFNPPVNRMSETPATSDDFVFTLKVSLFELKPPVWRRVVVPGTLTLQALHGVIQTAMGWFDCHLHHFLIGTGRYTLPRPDDETPVLDERKFSLRQVAPLVGSRFRYEYDFGDSWLHEITVEDISPAPADYLGPVCLDGARACPPEDIGGIPGYEHFLKDQGRGRRKGKPAGGEFDPEAFSVDWVNELLRKAPARKRRK
jgi:Plasmid pRiA4b ORF-3-like protein